MQKKNTYVVAGGTFDHFHLGHELFLKTAIEAGDHLALGITSDEMIAEKPLPYSIEPFYVRKRYVEQYLKRIKGNVKVQIMKLEEPFGISISDPKIEKIIVTKETKPNAIRINQIRKKNHLKALKILTVPYVKGSDNRRISSFRIRKGEIDRQGISYFSLLISRQIYHLPDTLKVSLREPLGHVFSKKEGIVKYLNMSRGRVESVNQNKMIVSVGDISSLTLLELGIQPSLMIYDYITRREALSHIQKKQLQIQVKKTILNKPGTIRKSAIIAIYDAIKTILNTGDNLGIKVIGEEDLLVLPTILMAPLGSLICYGQKDLGFIIVVVTETIKEKIKELLQKFN